MQSVLRNRKSWLAFFGIIAVFGMGAAPDPDRPPGCAPVPPEPPKPEPVCSEKGSLWKTVSLFGGNTGGSFPAAAASYRDASYTVGVQQVPGEPQRWTVRRSLDRGETWTTVDTFYFHPDQGTIPTSVAIDPRNGHVYVMGGTMSEGSDFSSKNWVVRKSTDQGATWKTIDDYAPGGARAVTVDENGVVYVVGSKGRPDLGGVRMGVVRKSTDGGVTWTQKEFSQIDYFTTAAAGIGTGIFLGGVKKATNTSAPVQWQIIHNLAGTDDYPWYEVDDVPQGSALIGSVMNPKTGRVLFFGQAEDGTAKWFIRESSQSTPGNYWTIDDYRPLDFTKGFGHARAEAATFAKDGSVYVSGLAVEPEGADLFFLTREGNPPTTLFNENDRVRIGAAPASPPFEGAFHSSAITTTGAGDILTVYGMPNTFGGSDWVMRKKVCK